jgi:hypothetical protein
MVGVVADMKACSIAFLEVDKKAKRVLTSLQIMSSYTRAEKDARDRGPNREFLARFPAQRREHTGKNGPP